MEIWNKLSETDPKYTKDFGGEKGFKGKAINPTYGMKKLTEAFGPCGIGWGTEIVESRFDEGIWLTERDREIIHTIILKLWYEGESNGQKVKFEIIGVGTTIFIGKNRHGVYTDGEFFKKTMTDAFTNAAKQLGLSADVFMGLYDDSKYLNEVKNKFAPKPEMPKRSAVNKALAACETKDDHQKTANAFTKKYGNIYDNFSGNPQNKGETWQTLFGTHLDRITGKPPVEASQTPEDLQKSFDNLVDSSDSWASYDFVADMLEKNPALDNQKNIDAVLSLEHDLAERLGARE